MPEPCALPVLESAGGVSASARAGWMLVSKRAGRRSRCRGDGQLHRRRHAHGPHTVTMVVASPSLRRMLNALHLHGCRVQQRPGDSVRATCPTHRDARPSLVVTHRNGRILLCCFAGCRVSEIVRTLGLTMADLFDGPRSVAGRRRIVARYAYTDLQGEIIAEKVRTAPKGFWWQSPDPAAPSGWRRGFGRTPPGLYRCSELIDARRVVVVEGEKAVDCLRALGVAATCPPAGASTWLPSWSEDLWRAGCSDVIVLPDADVTGRRHAERVAATCYGVALTSVSADMETPIASWPNAKPGDPEIAPLRVKLVPLPDLPANGDVVDFLERRSIADLQHLIEAAPYWTPDGAEQKRRDRRREKAAERQRRRRARLRAERETFGARHAANVRGRPVTQSRRHALRTYVFLRYMSPEERTRTEHSQRDRVRRAA